MTQNETRWKRLIVKWTAPKGLATILLFFAIGVIIEVLLVSAFQIMGLNDPNALTSSLTVPVTNWIFTVSISPLLHLMPLSVIIVMLTSWTYLANSTAFVPQRVEAIRRPSQPPKRMQDTGRLQSVRRFFRNLNRGLQRFSRRIGSSVQKTPGIGYVSQRLSLTRITVRSAAAVLAVFISVAVGLFFIEYPNAIYYLTLNLYMGSPAFQEFVMGVGQWLQGVGAALPPLGDLGAGINNALVGGAPGFRRSLEAAGTSLTRPIFQLDVVGKYALSQNLAAWIAAVYALFYGGYAARRPRRRIKGR